MATKTPAPSKESIYNNNWVVGLVFFLLGVGVALALYYASVSDLIIKIRDTDKNVKEINSSVGFIKQHYLHRVENGVQVTAGLSHEMKGRNISVYQGNDLKLNYSDHIILANIANEFRPTINVVVALEEQKKDGATATIFIGFEAAEMLGISKDELRKGTYQLYLKKLEKGAINGTLSQ